MPPSGTDAPGTASPEGSGFAPGTGLTSLLPGAPGASTDPSLQPLPASLWDGAQLCGLGPPSPPGQAWWGCWGQVRPLPVSAHCSPAGDSAPDGGLALRLVWTLEPWETSATPRRRQRPEGAPGPASASSGGQPAQPRAPGVGTRCLWVFQESGHLCARSRFPLTAQGGGAWLRHSGGSRPSNPGLSDPNTYF